MIKKRTIKTSIFSKCFYIYAFFLQIGSTHAQWEFFPPPPFEGLSQDGSCIDRSWTDSPRWLETFKRNWRNPQLPYNVESEVCVRSLETVSTIVLHHTGTFPDATVERMNEEHRSRGEGANSWAMIGYHYLIEGLNKPTNSKEFARVVTARPLTWAGAHTGPSTMTSRYLSLEDRQRLKNSPLKCATAASASAGDDGPYFPKDPKKYGMNDVTIGIAVIGNFKDFNWLNFSGIDPDTKKVNEEVLKQIGKLSCYLQLSLPNLKKIVVHKDIRDTSCPGALSLPENLEKIKLYAKVYGCDF